MGVCFGCCAGDVEPLPPPPPPPPEAFYPPILPIRVEPQPAAVNRGINYGGMDFRQMSDRAFYGSLEREKTLMEREKTLKLKLKLPKFKKGFLPKTN